MNAPFDTAFAARREKADAEQVIAKMKGRLQEQTALYLRARLIATMVFGGPGLDAELLRLVEEVVLKYHGLDADEVRQHEQELADRISRM